MFFAYSLLIILEWITTTQKALSRTFETLLWYYIPAYQAIYESRSWACFKQK